MIPLSCVLSLVPKFFCVFPVSRGPLSVVYSRECAAAMTMYPLSLPSKISIDCGR